MQVSAVEYHYQPAKFDSTTEKQESYKHWDLPARPARPPAPMRAILPFTGFPLITANDNSGLHFSICCTNTLPRTRRSALL